MFKDIQYSKKLTRDFNKLYPYKCDHDHDHDGSCNINLELNVFVCTNGSWHGPHLEYHLVFTKILQHCPNTPNKAILSSLHESLFGIFRICYLIPYSFNFDNHSDFFVVALIFNRNLSIATSISLIIVFVTALLPFVRQFVFWSIHCHYYNVDIVLTDIRCIITVCIMPKYNVIRTCLGPCHGQCYCVRVVSFLL